ncbi:AraC family transcriptional regulator [Paludibacterium paludis]|uniref:Transcriptional regulator n=1 Tax=Paludibacterium paludis TaxID=1225769 RepID=A0A918UB03_9NEIS|nr:helix-turn-helix transcriptional regulator [Paludibacterium paludis]GGY19974.1 transcriptional regulator [Paludibacterium paludis]
MPHYLPNEVPDPDHATCPLLGLAVDAPAPHDSGIHSHRRAQLLYAVSGVLQISVANRRYVLPPALAAWIPAGLAHSAEAARPFAYRSLYFDTAVFADLPGDANILSVGPLLRELVLRAATWPNAPLDPAQLRLARVLIDEIRAAPIAPLVLPLPVDRRLARIVETLLADPGHPDGLEAFAAMSGASGRTVNRLFHKETGMGFAAWRRQLTLQEASKRLAMGQTVTRVATDLGYAGESAFIAMFRKATGHTPGQARWAPPSTGPGRPSRSSRE